MAKNTKTVRKTTKSKKILGIFPKLKPWKWVSLFLTFVGLFLLCVSLTHLAEGCRKITGDSLLLSWCLAIGIDLGIVGFKLSQIVGAGKPVWDDIGKKMNTALLVCLSMSGFINILSYTEGKVVGSFNFYCCLMFGAFLPYAIWALSTGAAKLWLEGHKLFKKDDLTLDKQTGTRSSRKTTSPRRNPTLAVRG